MSGKKHQQQQLASPQNGVNNRLAAFIAACISKLQHHFVNLMNCVCNKIGIAATKKLLLLVCAASAVYCIHLVALQVRRANTKLLIAKPSAIQLPITVRSDEAMPPKQIVDSTIIVNINQFKALLDSLKQFQTTRYDSIRHSRPGLIDSIRMLEEHFYLQQKN